MTDIYKAPEAELNNPSVAGEYGSVEKALAGEYELKPIEVLKEAWANLKGMKTTYWIAAIVYGLIYLAVTFALAAVVGRSVDPVTGEFSIVAFIAEMSIGFLMAPLGAGLFMIALKHSVGVNIEVGELFKHFDKIVPLFIVYLLFYILVALGFVLLIIPGIYLMIAFSMAIPLVIEKKMAPWEALMTSRKAVTHKWFQMFGFALLNILVVTVGMIALLVGLIWAVPLIMLAAAMIYRDMFGVEGSTLDN